MPNKKRQGFRVTKLIRARKGQEFCRRILEKRILKKLEDTGKLLVMYLITILFFIICFSLENFLLFFPGKKIKNNFYCFLFYLFFFSCSFFQIKNFPTREECQVKFMKA